MQKANYNNTSTASGAKGKYPVSTQTLDFIQQQIMLLQQGITLIGGKNYIIREPDGITAGLCVVNGEILELTPIPRRTPLTKYININTSKVDIKADGETYTEARVYRTASYAEKPIGENYLLQTFASHTTNQTLNQLVRQVPQTVLNYLQKDLSERLMISSREGLTNEDLDAIDTPCIVDCTNSVAIKGKSNYGIAVIPMGNTVCQVAILSDGTELIRRKEGGTWTEFTRGVNHYSIECKIIGGQVYIRHGELPPSAQLVMVRKKRRSKWRSTGGPRSEKYNQGIRVPRTPKRQYVHFHDIVLDKGEADKWYSPVCIDVGNKLDDRKLIGLGLASLCDTLIKPLAPFEGNEMWRVNGVRNPVSTLTGDHFKRHAYVQVGIQCIDKLGNVELTGTEILRLKYHLRIKTITTGEYVDAMPVRKEVFYRTFSFE